MTEEEVKLHIRAWLSDPYSVSSKDGIVLATALRAIESLHMLKKMIKDGEHLYPEIDINRWKEYHKMLSKAAENQHDYVFPKGENNGFQRVYDKTPTDVKETGREDKARRPHNTVGKRVFQTDHGLQADL